MPIFIGYLVTRIGLAVLLTAAGSAKLADNAGFTNTLMSLGGNAYGKKIAQVLALSISLLELLVGGIMLSGFWPILMNAILLGLMCCFSIIVIFALYKALHTRCRCFGALSNSQFSKRGLVRNMVFTAIALFVFVSSLYFQPFQTYGSLWMRLLLITGYALFAFGVAQAAKTGYQIKEGVAA
jgi:uncharacterized membrane protein YphA (DoxX/SURF4 family)